jgi:8-oxo-dGTP pyrophosphatase MutT (NUDIX family)
MNHQPAQTAMAILYQGDKCLMQLRDDFPHIIAPGRWGLFGGHLEPGETPEDALKRELIEEIGYELPSFAKFGVYADERVIRHVFQVPLLLELEQLVLNEGWDMGLLTPEDIRQGKCYSVNAGEVRLLGDMHHRIMLDFINSKYQIS